MQPSTRHAQVTISQSEEALRLDYWLARRFTYHSRHYWQQEIRRGRVQINSERAKSSRKLCIGDRINYEFPSHPEPAVDPRFEVILEDGDVLVINKPGNLPCHPAGKYFHNTLWQLLKCRLDEFWLVNRLDRETSGVVMVAKTKASARHLSHQFSSRSVKKEYHVLVEGDFPPTLSAEGYLRCDQDSSVRKKQCFDTNGDSSDDYALTHFTLLSKCAGFSLVQAIPKTGKFHQIRATLSSLGFPVVGDKLYGVDDQLYIRQSCGSLEDTDYRALKLKTQALHAAQLTYRHPSTEKRTTVSAEYPPDLRSFLRCSGFECDGNTE